LNVLVNYNKGWRTWGDMIDFSPAPFHRRRLILKTTRSLEFKSVLDVGCGNGALLGELEKKSLPELVGIDLSELVIKENGQRFSGLRFQALDVSKNALEEKFDLVICSEVLEHIDNLAAALANLRRMCRRYLIITVPTGRVFPIDQKMGHVRHFSSTEIRDCLKPHGLRVLLLKKWGFPFHTLYKHLINLRPNACLNHFAEAKYGRLEMLVSTLLRLLFYLNLGTGGLQILCLAEVESR
jgi:SAM-dependent methyltransferase